MRGLYWHIPYPAPCPYMSPTEARTVLPIPFFFLPPCFPYRPFSAGTAPVPDPYRFARTGHVPFTRTLPFPDPYRAHTLASSNPYPTGRPTKWSQYLPVSDTCQYHFRSVQWRSTAACLLILIRRSVHAKSSIVNSNPLPGCFSWSSRYVVFRPFLCFTVVSCSSFST